MSLQQELRHFQSELLKVQTNSDYYSIVKRGLRIHTEDKDKFSTINDFVGYRVGAVKGMTSYIDLLNRTPVGVEIIAPDSFEELYALLILVQSKRLLKDFMYFRVMKMISIISMKTRK